jgi:hypothetical protein
MKMPVMERREGQGAPFAVNSDRFLLPQVDT